MYILKKYFSKYLYTYNIAYLCVYIALKYVDFNKFKIIKI